MNEGLLNRYLEHTEDNEAEIVSSSKVACLSCGTISSAREVKEWDDDEGKVKACCPLCGLPTVVGDASRLPLDQDTVLKIRSHLLHSGGDKRYHNEMRRYCDRFIGNEIEHNAFSEKIFLRYSRFLAALGEPNAFSDLGDFYMNGGVSVPADRDESAKWYSDPVLAYDCPALINLAIIYHGGTAKRKANPKKVVELLTKAEMLGSHKARMMLCDLYDEGQGVKADPFLSTKVLTGLYDLAYHSYLIQGYDPDLDLGEIAARLFAHFHQGFGAAVDDEGAFGLALVASYCIQANPDQYDKAFGRQVEGFVNELAAQYGYKTAEMVFDVDTFNDSMLMLPRAYLLRLSNLEFDAASHTLTFDLLSPTPVLLLDYASLQTKLLSGSQSFAFDSVAQVKGDDLGDVNFSAYRLEGDSLRFFRLGEDGEREILRIELFPKEQGK